jgi:hypothetical protein
MEVAMLDILTDGTQLTDAQRHSALEAARAVFARYQEDPWACYRVYGYTIRGPLNLGRSEVRLIEVWEEAEGAAIAAACGGRPTSDLHLDYLPDGEHPAAAA